MDYAGHGGGHHGPPHHHGHHHHGQHGGGGGGHMPHAGAGMQHQGHHQQHHHHHGGHHHSFQPMFAGPAGNMDNEFPEIHSIMADGGDRFALSAVAFDTQEELLWMGNQGGHVTSYYSLTLQKYTSFQVHPTNDIRQILPLEGGIVCLTSDMLRCYARFGNSQYSYTDENLQNMQCMLQNSPTSLLIAGHQKTVIEFDFNQGRRLRLMEVGEHGCAILRYSNRYICAGDTSGKVTLRDPNTLKAEHVLDAHNGTLSDFDVRDNLLVTCGFSNRMGSLTMDRYMKVYDLRVMRAVAPLQASIDPMFIRFISEYPNRIAVVSQAGQFQLMDTASVSNPQLCLYQVHTEGAMIMACDVSTSYQALGFGDSGGFLHLFAQSHEENVFNTYSRDTTFADPVESLQALHINDEVTPYSLVPMQYPTQGKLLSDMPDYLLEKTYRRPQAVDPEILRTVKYTQNVGYAPNPGTRHRNEVPYQLKSNDSKGNKKRTVPDSPSGRGDDPFIIVPKHYRKVEIKYSKLGLEDFDFRHYNKTNFAGLETHIPNAYCNAMLQMLYFIEPLRVALLSHLCQKESCISCELGFLFHMLDKQKGQTCQANNFLRAFRTIPEVSGLGLVLSETDEQTGKVNYPRLIQSWNRFILQQIHSECMTALKEEEAEEQDAVAAAEKEKNEGGAVAAAATEGEDDKKEDEKPSDAAAATQPAPVIPVEGSKFDNLKKRLLMPEKLFCMETVNKFKCRCSLETERNSVTLSMNMSYPDCLPQGQEKQPRQYSFSDVLQSSICSEQTTQGWCNTCNRYQPHTQTKSIRKLPDMIVINCNLDNTKDLEFWRIQQDTLKKQNAGNVKPDSPCMMNLRPCRYGAACTRKDCKFSHPGADGLYSRECPHTPPCDEPNYPAWVPYGIKVIQLEDGQLKIVNRPSELDEKQTDASERVCYYDLYGTVGHIQDPKSGGNLVSHVHVGDSYHRMKEGVTCSQWYLFNDFAIEPIEKHEAVHFTLDWKIPCCIYFMKSDLPKLYPYKVDNPINKDVLFDYGSIVSPRRRQLTFTHLLPEECPGKGDLVGLDAEFVTLNQEEAEIRSDGTKSTIKPSQMTCARITCVRGGGDKVGEPFLDDYISTQEQVVDYLTQFSGIKPGDLDANFSSKHLTTLKSTYVKLRYLVDSGVVFVGHGLKKDFRVINIVVPKQQVFDTVELFHLPRQRMISLKFLAWYFLKTNIQSVTHDSIEDARTALKLYAKYQEEKAKGPHFIADMLKDLYECGRKLSWKVPDGSEEPAERTS
ncbi:PAN2-PAN3 deadenylation complex catalytic subunit PAN2-like [Tubulanus polymorphus]|uniref:PAN2-PAN3 deadenylation complex catalytic subunit PAN2-like n=1 Tax=Tubulanus polymorphus TaxID=672921 RepID=UPI003DA3390E